MKTSTTKQETRPATEPQSIAIVYRARTDVAVKKARELAAWLKKQNHIVWTAPDQKRIAGTDLMKQSRQMDKVDLVVVLGGDGTYLRAVRLLEGRQIPILGFNMGSLGFLTVHPIAEVQKIVARTLAGEMTTSPRTMIEATVKRGKKTLGRFKALNDIVLERGSYSHLINSAIFLGSRKVSEVKADGFIVASPTGSTAYNLAAGGPILDPSVQAFAITPVAAHALTSRPLIVPDDIEITLHLVPGRGQKSHFIVDGQKVLEVGDSDEIIIKKSRDLHLIIRDKGFNDFQILKEKLKFGDRA